MVLKSVVVIIALSAAFALGDPPPQAPPIDERLNAVESTVKAHDSTLKTHSERLNLVERDLEAVKNGKPQASTVPGCQCPEGKCICPPGECKCENCPIHGKPALRAAYEAEVEALGQFRERLEAQGEDAETIARKLHAARRELGEKYKNLTPADLRERIRERNVSVYGDALGPAIEWLRGKGKTWEQIAESASDPGDWPPKGMKSSGVRVLFFTADWCAPCQAAKARLGDLLEQLEIVDCTDGNPMAEYSSVRYPTCILLDSDGKVKSRCVGEWVKPSIVGDWLEGKALRAAGAGDLLEHKTAPAPVRDSRANTTTRTVNSAPSPNQSRNYHTHTCKSCGTAWSHGPEAANNPRAHNCPQCGRREYDITPTGPAIRSTPVVIQPRGGYWQRQCQSGQCRNVWIGF